ncbi:ABC transporter permease [Faecalispora anaeroviscerum]|uniref:ABC transporter permease n=1 Tax=Faecalispora anaeroviscerum TaxID=2991836 RepID=UPI0024B88D0E|nr:ABC transporter permease [Faecalispora anaeroviscerum]
MADIFRSAFQNLGRKRLRTALTMMGVAIGVASVILIGNISQCGTDALTHEFDSLGLSGLSISTLENDSQVVLTDTDLKVVRESENVEMAMPVMMQATSVQTTRITGKALAWGIDADANQIISLNILYGRSISVSDVKSGARVCMVDENFSQASYKRNNIIGKKLSITCSSGTEEFEVVGIVKTGSGLLQNFIGNYIPNFVYIPYSTMQQLLGKNSFDQIAVKLKSGTDVDKTGDLLVQSLNRTNGSSNAFVSNNLMKQRDSLSNILGVITLILSSVGAISLLVASLSIMTVMLVSVNERTREIGIKKSIGARRKDILLEFMFEAILITLIGSIFGILAGYGISYLGASYFGFTLGIRLDIMALAVGFSILTGMVFGVYPAMKAARMNPVDALRME